MPGAGSLAMCQCCCVDRLCSRGGTGALRPNWMEQSGMKHAGLLFHAAAQKAAAHVERRFKAVKKYYFLTKGLQSAARIICAPQAHKFHTCSLRSIFFAAHVAEENDWTFFAPAGANSTRFFDKLTMGLLCEHGGIPLCLVYIITPLRTPARRSPQGSRQIRSDRRRSR